MDMVIRYLIPQIKDIELIEQICKAIANELERLETGTKRILNNFFILDLDADGCVRFEKMLDIKPLSTDSLEDRRFRILATINGDLPYTKISLKEKLYNLCGKENVNISYNHETHTITVRIGLRSKNQFNTAIELIQRLKPCNMILDGDLEYNTHKTLRLNAGLHLLLKPYTHEQLRTEYIEYPKADIDI